VQEIVHSSGEQSVGLLVDRILDIVAETLVIQRTGSRPGVLGSAVIEKRVTELLDVDGVIRSVLSSAHQETAAAA
jgi:two-component system chemotaxis sensor kinase CheA